MTTKLERFTRMARDEPPKRFNALMGLLSDPEGLRESFERQDVNRGQTTVSDFAEKGQ